MTSGGILSTRKAALSLQQLEGKDAPTIYQLVQDSSAHLTRLGDYTDLVAMTCEDLANQFSDGTSQQQFGLVLKETKLIGVVSLIQYGNSIFGLGYWIGEAYSGFGYMTEAVRAGIDFAVREKSATELWAGIRHDNEASIKLVKRLGFELAREQESHLSFRMSVSVDSESKIK